MKEETKNILIIGVGILLLASFLFIGKTSFTGSTTFQMPTQVYGSIRPSLSDGIIIKFMVGDVLVGEGKLKDNKYGYDEQIFFERDDLSTTQKEGYANSDTVTVYLENVEIATLYYFGSKEKNFQLSTIQRNEVSRQFSERTKKTDV